MAFRSFARVALFASLFALVVVGCGRSWLGDIDETGTDGGSPEAGPREGGPDGEAGACGPATCATGCCTPAGVCITGSTPNACGIGGAICVDCTTKGFPVCDAQTHQCESNVTNCSPASCPTGCCSGNLCISGTSVEDCGNFGDVCQDCVQSGLTCQGQACTQAACGPGNCAGCCFGNQCLDGVGQAACGVQGEQCQNCLAANETCLPTPAGGGICEGVVSTCNDMTCPGGCCDTNGFCEQGTTSTACGANAVLCQNCLQVGATCQFQECVPSLGCNPQTCPTGCCDANGLCESGQSPTACGNFGNDCQNCASAGVACDAQACDFPDSGTCNSLTCPDGCCDASGFCEPGQAPFACGDFGNACEDCSAVGEVCSGQVCAIDGGIEAGTCGPQSCPGGCCDSLGLCQSGTMNGACGFGGGLCESCSQFGDVCAPSQQCVVAPPPCTATSCPNGCCDANGLCEAGFIDNACGQGGAQCADCASSGSTCDTAVTPRVCNSAQMTCPTSFTSCPSNLAPTPTFSTTACSNNDLQNGAVACAGGAHTALCQQFLQFEQMNNASCGACLQQFDFDLSEVQGVLACIEPFVSDPSCLDTIACLDQCENVSCAMCASGSTEACENTVEQGQCSTWTNQIQCTFPEFEGDGAVCDPNNTGNFGTWLEAVGQTFCSSQVIVIDP